MRTLLALTPRRAALTTTRPVPRTRPWLLVALALALALLAAPGAAGAEPDPGNSWAAQACQKGGYKNFVRADGTPFANTGECASYAAQGGTFDPVVQLPDLRVDVVCSTLTIPELSFPYVLCTITATNIGTVPVTGAVVLRGEARLSTGSREGGFDFGGDRLEGCDPRDVTGEITTDDDYVSVVVEATCGRTVLPGEEALYMFYIFGTESPGMPFTITAAVDPYNTIIESDEANNTHDITGATP